MSDDHCRSDAPETCLDDTRRPCVRLSTTLGGIDYVEVRPDGVSLCVHFFGAVPEHLGIDNVAIEGGARIRDIAVLDARFHDHDDGDLCLLLTLDQTGDFSRYCVCLIEAEPVSVKCSGDRVPAQTRRIPKGIDPRYACAMFSFRQDCPATLDCAPEPCPPAPRPPLPAIDYLARDYETFRRVLLDRLAQTMPDWRERHVPDLGITLVELFAYVADQLSYQLDAVATEAYLRTARKRISVKRHARLVDYWMHEGCNARAWITLHTDDDFTLDTRDVQFAVLAGESRRGGGVLDRLDLERDPDTRVFEPVTLGKTGRFEVVAAHSELQFYDWGRSDCCLESGSTRATLLDHAPDPSPDATQDGKARETARRLKLKAGAFLILEETRACSTGREVDADPSHRHVVRLTGAWPAVDPLTGSAVWEIEWAREDALPFTLHLTARTSVPDCARLPAAVGRGNVLLVDHGAYHDDQPVQPVGSTGDSCCMCDGASYAQRPGTAHLTIGLTRHPLTYAEPVPRSTLASARALMSRDPRQAVPALCLIAEAVAPATASDGTTRLDPKLPVSEQWHAVRDLLASGPRDRHFVVEIDDDSEAHVRFGDDVNGATPKVGWTFMPRYRVGSGPAGLVGRDAIVWIASRTGKTPFPRGLRSRNPLPSTGGIAPESIGDVKLHAPFAFGRVLERAVSAADYSQLASLDPRVQGAFAELAWCGSWYEASASLDALALFEPGEVNRDATSRLERARRIGHDLRLLPPRRIPLDLAITICVEPHHLRGDVERAARRLLGSGVLPDGAPAMFHPDELSFGKDVSASRIVAAVQALPGVAHVELTRFARLFAAKAEAEATRDANIIAIDADEVPQLDASPNFPERGRIAVEMKGGR